VLHLNKIIFSVCNYSLNEHCRNIITRKGVIKDMKKFTTLAATIAILTVIALSGCQRQEGQKGGQAPEKSAPTTSPTTTQ
jgi:preprotein translocase subunit SecG